MLDRRPKQSLLALALALAAVLAACGGSDATDLEGDGGASSGAGGSDGGAASPDGAATGAADAAAKTDASAVDAGPEQSGEATYYVANGTGACGFAITNDQLVAAMNGAQYSKATCGKCVEVTGPLGSVVVRIADKCPGCKSGDLDLSQSAFQKIAKLSAGRVPITWHFVACP